MCYSSQPRIKMSKLNNGDPLEAPGKATNKLKTYRPSVFHNKSSILLYYLKSVKSAFQVSNQTILYIDKDNIA